MLEFYPQIKSVHVVSVVASVALFALRGGLLLAGRQRCARWLPLRWASWSIDTVLLSAALMLLTILPSALFANHWLSAKLALLLAYIGLGRFALCHARTPASRAGGYVAALAVVALMYSIARSHHPLGFLRLIGA